MKKTERIYICLVLLSVMVGCGPKKAERFTPLPFPQVKVPAMYSDDNESAMEYAAVHFWDALADTSRCYPSDSSLVSGVRRSDIEKNYANYAGLLGMLPRQAASSALEAMTGRIILCEETDSASDVFETLVAMTEKYLYDPNSPLRNEDLYLVCASEWSEYDGFSPETRARYANEAEMCSLNMTGTVAADFSFSDKAGRVRRLHDIDAEYTLLFFSNPGCEACMDIIRALTSSQAINGLLSEGTLAVVNIYIDEDIAAWYDYMPVYPDTWYNGYDHNMVIRNDTLYNVRAIPSLYLLDSGKTVLMKDAVPDNVLYFLENNF